METNKRTTPAYSNEDKKQLFFLYLW